MDEPSNLLRIPIVMDRDECGRHGAPLGIPCFHVPKSSGNGYYAGICNKRAKKAGFNSRVSPEAMRSKSAR